MSALKDELHGFDGLDNSPLRSIRSAKSTRGPSFTNAELFEIYEAACSDTPPAIEIPQVTISPAGSPPSASPQPAAPPNPYLPPAKPSSMPTSQSSRKTVWAEYNIALADELERLQDIPNQFSLIQKHGQEADKKLEKTKTELKKTRAVLEKTTEELVQAKAEMIEMKKEMHIFMGEVHKLILAQNTQSAEAAKSLDTTLGLTIAIAGHLELAPEEYPLPGTPNANRLQAIDKLVVNGLPSELKSRIYGASHDFVFRSGFDMVADPLGPDIDQWCQEVIEPKLLGPELEIFQNLTPNQLHILYRMSVIELSKHQGQHDDAAHQHHFHPSKKSPISNSNPNENSLKHRLGSHIPGLLSSSNTGSPTHKTGFLGKLRPHRAGSVGSVRSMHARAKSVPSGVNIFTPPQSRDFDSGA